MTTEVKNKILELREEGMGYGKIGQELNLKKITVAKFIERLEAKAKMPRIGVCPECGKEFAYTPGPTPKRFCCAECKQKWWNKNRLDKKRTYLNTCEHCGKLFKTVDKNAKYCSRKCYMDERFGK